MYEDKSLTCKECGNEFIFTAGEQEFYAERGFANEPRRCKACRYALRSRKKEDGVSYTTICAMCGGEAIVPFEPTGDRPVYCSECYAKIKSNEETPGVNNEGRKGRVLYTAICAMCGGEARVPFEPTGDRPVYCSVCFAKIKSNEETPGVDYATNKSSEEPPSVDYETNKSSEEPPSVDVG